MMNEFPGRQYETFGERLLSKRKSSWRMWLAAEYAFKACVVLPLAALAVVLLILLCIFFAALLGNGYQSQLVTYH